jgi:hypothetical protein
MIWIVIGGFAWAVAAGAAARFASSKWHPDKGRSLEEALAPYQRTDDRKENG